MKLVGALVATAVIGVAAATSTPEQARAFERKIQEIVAHGESGGGPRQTVVTEAEVNAYLRFGAADQLPVGVTDPFIGIDGDGRLHGRAIVDLDRVRRAKSSGGWFDPLSYVTGRVPVTASGVLHSASGRGRFTLETAAVGGVPIPKTLLQEIVTYYTRSADFPKGINIDDPFALPAAIQRIDVHPGRATIIQ